LEANRKALVDPSTEPATDWFFLFADFAHVGNAPAETFRAVAALRITEHKEAEAERKKKAEAAAAPPPAPAPTPTPATVAQPAASSRPVAASPTATLKLGDINARLSPIQLTADGLAALGFPHAGTDRAAKLYRPSDFPRICEALIAHVEAALAPEAA